MVQAKHQEGLATGQDGETQPNQNAEGQPGAEKTTYTQEQVNEITAGKDREATILRHRVQQFGLNEETRKARQAESGQVSEDFQSVEDGTLTAAQAASRAEARITVSETVRNSETAMDELIVKTGQMGRFNFSQELAQEFTLTPQEAKVLENNMTITSQDQMRLEAGKVKLAKDRATQKGTERFDSGQVGTKGVAVDEMSGAEKIRHALNNA
jgi:uncharacterized cupredoxin-like copper-binding protein